MPRQEQKAWKNLLSVISCLRSKAETMVVFQKIVPSPDFLSIFLKKSGISPCFFSPASFIMLPVMIRGQSQ